MYATDGYVDGAGKEMAKALAAYKISVLVTNSKISRFFWTQYIQGQRIPPSVKKKILSHLRKNIKGLESAILIEETRAS